MPLIFVAYTTSPFVSFVHLRLPPWARQSEEMLRRFVQGLSAPASGQGPVVAELELTTMSLIAKPRLSRVAVADLRPASARFGIANYVRDVAAENAARKWYQFRAVGSFSVQSANKMPRFAWVWDAVANVIAGKRV